MINLYKILKSEKQYFIIIYNYLKIGSTDKLWLYDKKRKYKDIN